MIEFNTISELFINAKNSYQDKIAFQFKSDNNWIDISHNLLHSNVSKLAHAIYDLGLRKGDKVLLLSENRIEWIYFDAACSHLGITTIPVFPTTSPKQLEYIINHSDCQGVVASNNFQMKKIEEVIAEIPNVRHIISIEETNIKLHSLVTYNELLNKVKASSNEIEEFIKKHSELVKPDDILSIIYTSGTTGNPKGVMLSHKNLVANIKGALNLGYFSNFERSLSYLPLCHAYERTAGYYVMFSTSCTIALCDSIDQISSYMGAVKPQLMTTVPKLMETIKTKIFNAMLKEDKKKQKIFNWSVAVGYKHINNQLNRKTNLITALQFKIAEKILFSKIKAKLGGQLKYLVSGGAAMNYDTALFFEMLGAKTLQGYGLTEASPCISINLPDTNEPDSVGKPFFNMEIKINPDGEILCRGDNVMVGYLNDEKATAEVIDTDNWLHTGDIGIITDLGNIKITDRKKNIFVTSSGKNIAPQVIENQLMKSKYTEQVFLIGEGKEYCSALIYPNEDQILFLAKEFELDSPFKELITNLKILKHVKHDFDFQLKDLSKFEQVRKFVFLEKPFTIEGGELSHKMSVKRHVVEEKYKEQISSMY